MFSITACTDASMKDAEEGSSGEAAEQAPRKRGALNNRVLFRSASRWRRAGRAVSREGMQRIGIPRGASI